VRITEGPELERATDSWAILRWTANNVKGTSLRYAVVHYGTDPHDLGLTAKSPNRWNPGLPTMIYRVQMNHLEPGTTYYYRVESVNASGAVEGPESAVGHFATKKVP
jgi:Purple acid Phosphatase, N-terminal domain